MMKNLRKLFVTLSLLVGLVSCGQTNTNRVQSNPNDKYVTGVSLNYTGEVVMELGETIKVDANISFKDDIELDVTKEFVSSRPKVASVDQLGVVTALSGGSTYISFMAGYKTAYFTVTIYSDEAGGSGGSSTEASIKLNAYSRTLSVGDTFQLSVTLNNPLGLDEAINYMSENSEVASVNESGLITANKAGDTNIVVSALGLNATCVISVSDDIEEGDFDYTIYFFIDYNNIDENDTTGKKLITKFGWYHNEPIANSGKVPADLTEADALDRAFPYFVGWSTHTIIDTAADLCDLTTYVEENAHFLFIYGIWSDVPAGEFKL